MADVQTQALRLLRSVCKHLRARASSFLNVSGTGGERLHRFPTWMMCPYLQYQPPIYIRVHHLQEIALPAKSNTPLTAF